MLIILIENDNDYKASNSVKSEEEKSSKIDKSEEKSLSKLIADEGDNGDQAWLFLAYAVDILSLCP